MARSAKKVMQFLSEGRYVANVEDAKFTRYGTARVILNRILKGLLSCRIAPNCILLDNLAFGSTVWVLSGVMVPF